MLTSFKIQKFSCGTFERNRKVTSPAIHAVERRQEKRKAQGLTPWSYKPQITNCIQWSGEKDGTEKYAKLLNMRKWSGEKF